MKNPTRSQLLKTLEEKGTSRGTYHTSEEIKDVLYAAFNDYGDGNDEIKDVDDLLDDMWRSADSAIPVYNADLLDWFAKNHDAVDDYINETGSTMGADGIIWLISASYCWTLQQEAEQELRIQYDYTQSELNQ